MSCRRPRAVAAIAIDARVHATVGTEGQRVLRLFVRPQDGVVAALEFHQLPCRPLEAGRARNVRAAEREHGRSETCEPPHRTPKLRRTLEPGYWTKVLEWKRRLRDVRTGRRTPVSAGRPAVPLQLVLLPLAFQQVAAAGTPRPVLPRALRFRRLRLVAGAGGARIDLAGAERLQLAELHRLLLHARIARQVHRHAHDVDQRARRGGEAV